VAPRSLLQLYSDKVIRSYNAFVPLFEYFFLHPSPNPEDRELPQELLLSFPAFNWYSGGTDQILGVVHTIVSRHRNRFPLAEVTDYFKNQGKRYPFDFGASE
jgi:hypothetical protein